MLVSLQHGLTVTQRGFRLRSPGNVQHERQQTVLVTDANRLHVKKPMPHLSGFRSKRLFQMTEKPLSTKGVRQLLPVFGVYPDTDVQRGHADQFSAAESRDPHESIVHIEHPAVFQPADGHSGRTALKRLGEPLLAFAQCLLNPFPPVISRATT